MPSYRGPCLASYLASMFLHLPSSFLKSATSWRRAEFSFSRNEARIAIWFSFSRRASRERLAAMLFFLRLAQYLSSFKSSGMKTLRAFLIMGCGFSSSSENFRLRGSNISCPGMLERARSAGSGSYPTGTWMVSGSMGLGVLRFAGNSWPGLMGLCIQFGDGMPGWRGAVARLLRSMTEGAVEEAGCKPGG